jgi:hypothetical protein
MARNVFYSFHYDDDSHRVQLVANMGAVSGQPILKTHEWEEVKKGGKSAIEKWIDDKMSGKSCVVVLIGAKTAERDWVQHELKKGWADGKGLLGIYINGLSDMSGQTTAKGKNPFGGYTVGESKTPLTSFAPTHDPSGSTSKDKYKTIEDNIADWVESAIELRKDFTG